MASYLLGMQTRRRTDLRLEKEAEERDSRRSGKTRDAAEVVDNSEDSMESDDGDESEEEKDVLPVRRSKNATKPQRIDSDDDEEDAADTKEKVRVVSKRKSPPAAVHEPPAKKAKTEKSVKAQVSFATPLPSRLSHDLIWSNLPPGCPAADCLDELPTEPNARILSLFSRRDVLIDEVGQYGAGVEFLDYQICAAIQQEANRDHYINLGRTRNWPQTIDYKALPARILSLRKYFIAMIHNQALLEQSDVWQTFLRMIDHKVFDFSASKSKLGYTYALLACRCGYSYGPKGEFLINSTILRILSDDENSLGYRLHSTLDSIISSDYDKYDEPDTNSDLIELNDFVSFILTPFAAALLIAQDMGVDLEPASDIRDNSNDFGDLMQPDNEDDELLANLHQENIQIMSESSSVFLQVPPPRSLKVKEVDSTLVNAKLKAARLNLANFEVDTSREKKNAKPSKNRGLSLDDFMLDLVADEEKPIVSLTPDAEKGQKKRKTKVALTVEDFPEPDPVAKKTAKKSKEKKSLKTAAPKPARKNKVQSNYGTRAKSKAGKL
ncbi:hypothetical protein K438DRAFT_1788922 [Mycena galopus ATCC 62051]|nr:hypothetical protein K438DRAFT_1788922 [Mycena galopus ATCC 62051]